MTAPREPALQFVGKLLDRAVDDTFRRLWPLAVPCILVDASGVVFDPFLGVFLASALYSGLMENLGMTFVVRSLKVSGGRRLALGALRYYPASLWFVACYALDWFVVGPVPLVPAIVVIPIAALSAARTTTAPFFVVLAIIGLCVLAEALLLVVLIALLLTLLAAAAAFVDVVADRMSPGPAILRWLRWCFRRKTIVPTLIAAAIFGVLFFGVTEGVETAATALLPKSGWIHTPVIGIPDGIADTIALVFAWHWRSAVLDLEFGRDLSADLDARATMLPSSG